MALAEPGTPQGHTMKLLCTAMCPEQIIFKKEGSLSLMHTSFMDFTATGSSAGHWCRYR